MKGYQVTHLVGKSKGGGGVSIYVINSLLFKGCSYMTTNVDDIMECLTVEIVSKNKNNVLVYCIYRAPGSCITNFTEIVSNLLRGTKNQRKNVILYGDYNINLMQYNSHNSTKEFVDMMFSFALYHIINKLNKITIDSATLFDIFL